MRRRDSYTTFDGRTIDISGLTSEQKTYLGEKILADKESNMNCVDFQNRYLEDSVVLSSPQLYEVCRDLATRLGIRQGYLKKESYEHKDSAEEKELTSPEVAEMGGCSAQAVRDAIQAGRLSARRVGPLYLIKERHARIFIASLRKNRISSRKSLHSREFPSRSLQAASRRS